MATITEQVSEVLVGTTEEPQLTQQTKATFMKYALQDEKTGEHYLGEEEFINAIAPESEDYVRPSSSCEE
jgi:solute carrier family 25 aspartate/glutamate transporter 12/13